MVFQVDSGSEVLTGIRSRVDRTRLDSFGRARDKRTNIDDTLTLLAGNLCRCSGYEGQLRGIRNFLDSRKACADEKNSN